MNSNLLSFLMSLCCIILFFITSMTSANFKNYFVSHFYFHPLSFVLLLTIITFFMALIGMKDVKNIISLTRGLTTLVLTLSLSGIISYILFVGSLFS